MTVDLATIIQAIIAGGVTLVFWRVQKVLSDVAKLNVTVAVIESKMESHAEIQAKVEKHNERIIILQGSTKRAHERIDVLSSKH